MSLLARTLSTFRRIGIVIAIAITFVFGLATTVYLSLRSSEVRVPEVVGKDRFEAEKILEASGLGFRVRATRPSNQSKPDTVLFQLPRAGEVVKSGQTVAMDISRASKEGEASDSEATDKKVAEEKAAAASNGSANANENKPRRPRNKNANENANANANGNANGNENRTGNSNRTRNSNEANTNAGTNVNQRSVNKDSNSENDNRRPAVTRPSPAVKPAPKNDNQQP